MLSHNFSSRDEDAGKKAHIKPHCKNAKAAAVLKMDKGETDCQKEYLYTVDIRFVNSMPLGETGRSTY